MARPYYGVDRGVFGNLVDRKFGSAGTYASVPRHMLAAAERRQRKYAVKAMNRMQARRPLKPPGKKT